MYISRLAFHTVPGKTHEVEQHLLQLREMVLKAGGTRPRVARTHFASFGAPDVIFEQEVPDLAVLESQLQHVTESAEFHRWTQQMSGLLTQSPKREVYQLVE
jgi:quinol monooxygenase YgiN